MFTKETALAVSFGALLLGCVEETGEFTASDHTMLNALISPPTADIIWQHSSGQIHYWPMLQGVRQGGIDIDTPVASDWTLRGVGDVNGDGTDDIIWQHSSGQVHYWLMRGGVHVDSHDIDTPVASDWTLRGIGDVNGDSADMLARLNMILADDTLAQALKPYARAELLVVDDVGLEQVERIEARRSGLMQKVLLPRYNQQRSTIITSNIPWRSSRMQGVCSIRSASFASRNMAETTGRCGCAWRATRCGRAGSAASSFALLWQRRIVRARGVDAPRAERSD